MVPHGGAPQATAQPEADAAAAAERAAAATPEASSAVAAAEAAAAEAAARARTAAAEAVAAEAAAAAAKVAAGQSAAPLAAGTASNMLLPDAQPTHSRAPEWSGPDSFLLYEEDVKVWLHITTLPDDKKGGAMRLALGGVAKKAARNVGVDHLVLPTGYQTLLECLRLIFGGSESQRGHDAYRTLKALYRGSRLMEEYLATIRKALVLCRINGYSMSGKTAAAIVLDQAGLDANQQASTKAAAAVLKIKGSDTLKAITISLRDLWGEDATLKPSSDAPMMVVTYGEHQAYLARRMTPAPGPKGGAEVYRGPSKAADPAGCWHCGKTGHIRRDCRKRAREAAAEGGSAPPTDGGGAPPGDGALVAQEVAHVVIAASPAAGEQMRARTGDVILDIGATATLAGTACVASYVARLPPGTRARINSVEAATVFTFGDGITQRAYERVTLPLLIGGASCYVRTWVVAGHLPMLLGRATMASLGVVLDVAACRMEVKALGVEVPFSMSAAGHLTLNALDSRAAAGVPSVPTEVAATAPRESSAMAAANVGEEKVGDKGNDNEKGVMSITGGLGVPHGGWDERWCDKDACSLCVPNTRSGTLGRPPRAPGAPVPLAPRVPGLSLSRGRRWPLLLPTHASRNAVACHTERHRDPQWATGTQCAMPGHSEPQWATGSYSEPQEATVSHSGPRGAPVGHGEPQWATGSHGESWPATESHSGPERATVGHGEPQWATGSHSESWTATESHSGPQQATVGHGEPQWATGSHSESLPATASHSGPRGATVSHGEPQGATVGHGEPQ